MTYDLSTAYDRQRFETRVRNLVGKGAAVELTEKAVRSLNQNAYLHAIIGVVAMETGNTLDYAKAEYFKRLVNPSLFVLEKDDKLAGKVTYLRSSASLTKEEMGIAIDRFKRWAAENGIYLPEPGDKELLASIEIEMAKNRRYL